MRSHEPLMFHELAPFYDRLLAGKDYRSETRRLEDLVHRYLRSDGREWLDVACGTGRHLELLRHKYSVTGLDRSAPMLAMARQRLPGIPLVRGEMQSFRLPGRFDVVTCLFGAIGNVTSFVGTQATIDNFARHLRPGGLLILEPWIDPSECRVGMLHLMQYEDPSTKVVRLAYSGRKGNCTVTRTHYLIGEQGSGLRHLRETDPRLMVP